MRRTRVVLFESMNDSKPLINSDKQTRHPKKFIRLSRAEIDQFIHLITVNYIGDCDTCKIKQIFICLYNEQVLWEFPKGKSRWIS